MPRIINITGNIGSGKSSITKVFQSLNVPVFISDDVSKFILTNNLDIVKKISTTFGSEILDVKGIPDTKKLGAIVFNNPEKTKTINSILHPEVKAVFHRWLNKQTSAFIVRESALVFETGLYREPGITITVTCPFYERVNRVQKRNAISLNKIFERENKQWPEWEKAEKSDYVIDNYNQAVIPQVLKIAKEITLI